MIVGLACVSLMLSVGHTPLAVAQLPAFPGADGAARDISGGRGGVVYHVTKLDKNFNDTGPGTLRFGLSDSNFPAGTPRTIVFDVAGTFWLGRFGEESGHDNGWDSQSRLNWGSNVTIAGQSAPGPVYIMGGVTKANGVNTILRNVAIAPGYGLRNFSKPEEGIFPTPGDFPDSFVYDAIDISGQNIMIDHVSTLYATDETISANELANNVTIQYSNISQGQNYPQAKADGSATFTGHAFGSLLQAGSGAKISVINNLYAHQKGRLPRVGSEVGTGAFNDFRNNVFYNWLSTAGTGASGQPSFNNFIDNFYLAGLGGDNPVGGSSTAITTSAGGTNVFNGASSSVTRVFQTGNFRDSNKDGDANDGTLLTNSNFSSSSIQSAAYDVNIGVTLSAQQAFENVLKYMGARWWDRDYNFTLGNTGAIDTPDERIIHEAYTGTGKIMAWADDPFNNDPNEGVEWRNLLSFRADPSTGSAPFSRSVGWDSDADGLPDHWELQHGLDPNLPNNNADFDADGYTDLEEYLNEVAAWPAPAPIVFNGANNRYAEINNWEVRGQTVNISGQGSVTTKSNWQPSRYDEAQINSGTVVVDAVGQHAGALMIATNSGDTATLNIASGWLQAEEGVVIGAVAGANGTLNLSGGRLVTPFLGKGPSGAFAFTGGTLSADVVAFDLDNQGGTLAPGKDIGVTWIMGDLSNSIGSIEVELAGTNPGQFDQILVDGNATLGGMLDVSLLSGFTLGPGTSFQILDIAGLRTGEFAGLTEGSSVGNFGLDLFITYMAGDGNDVALFTAASIAGDFDLDGDVDGADFLAWQRNSSVGNLADWQANFGMPSFTNALAVPEPLTTTLLFIVFLSVLYHHQRKTKLR